MTTIRVSLRHLKAACVLAAKKDIRNYLNGVLVQAWTNQTRLVATDGTALAVIRDEQDNDVPHGTAPLQFIVPRDLIDGIKAGKKDMESLVLGIEVPEEGPYRLTLGDTIKNFQPVDGRFPDYPRVIPSKVSGLTCQFDPELVDRMGQCLGILNGTSKGIVAMRVEHNGEVVRNEDGTERRADGAALVYGAYNNFVGVMMPLRDYPGDMGAEWARIPPELPALAEAA